MSVRCSKSANKKEKVCYSKFGIKQNAMFLSIKLQISLFIYLILVKHFYSFMLTQA